MATISQTQMECSESNPKDRRPDGLGELRVLPDELICSILEFLSPGDVGRLACVSSVMYILCNEEPLWITLCLKSTSGQLEYKGSWKQTTLHQQHYPDELVGSCRKSLHFDGFNSIFLYKRFYRCFTTLNAFSVDGGDVEKKNELSPDEFRCEFDGQKPVLLTELAETWSSRSTWTPQQILDNYGDVKFKLSQRTSGKITMKFKDYVSYMNLQHDEDPLYIFDDKFGEVAPTLLKDYSVPYLFQEDFFDVLDRDQRPPYRWLIIGPERSGASWHVDPGLTSAWNTLLCGRKRWALYPPGRVPLGVTVHVNDEDGDVVIDTPSSLQWWLDIYPMLADQDKPIECTQLPGETIYVPTGWWHCVLNLDTTIAVTQNFVNSKNFEFVCLDMAPGHLHKGVCRAGLLAIDAECSEDTKVNARSADVQLSYPDMNRKEKRQRVSKSGDHLHVHDNDENSNNGSFGSDSDLKSHDFSYEIDFLSMFLDAERDHYISVWSPSNCIGQREMRQWLHKLWVGKPGMRDLIWKGACLALNADKWSECMEEICAFHNLPSPLDDEKLPVGTGSNPVYLTADHVIKIYVEGGLESSIHGLGTELEFYSLLNSVNSPLKNHVPDVLASGFLFQENGSYGIVLWDGKGVPDVISKCNMIKEKCRRDGFAFGIWSKKEFDLKKAATPLPDTSVRSTTIWPYIITRRCKGDIFAHLRDTLSWNDVLYLASFLGDQLRNLHLLPIPSYDYFTSEKRILCNATPSTNVHVETIDEKYSFPVEWRLFVETLTRRKKDVSSRLAKWGDPIPSNLIEKVEEYLPNDFSILLNLFKDDNGIYKVCKSSSWIHSDIMDDNIYMEKCSISFDSAEHAMDVSSVVNQSGNGFSSSEEHMNWRPSYILDFSDLSIGDSICDLIPIHLDIFRGDQDLLQRFLKSYKLPFFRKAPLYQSIGNGKFERLSYHVMCYCILHEDNVLGSIFSLYKELKMANSWEAVEEMVWGELNKYEGFC